MYGTCACVWQVGCVVRPRDSGVHELRALVGGSRSGARVVRVPSCAKGCALRRVRCSRSSEARRCARGACGGGGRANRLRRGAPMRAGGRVRASMRSITARMARPCARGACSVDASRHADRARGRATGKRSCALKAGAGPCRGRRDRFVLSVVVGQPVRRCVRGCEDGWRVRARGRGRLQATPRLLLEGGWTEVRGWVAGASAGCRSAAGQLPRGCWKGVKAHRWLTGAEPLGRSRRARWTRGTDPWRVG